MLSFLHLSLPDVLRWIVLGFLAYLLRGLAWRLLARILPRRSGF